MSAGISVDLGSATPPYEQIRAQVASLIALGALAPGTRLPTVRSLAADLGIAAGTVARAYRELEQAGLIETRRRNGTVVAGTRGREPDRCPGAGDASPGRWPPPSTATLRKAEKRDSTTPPCWRSCGRGSASKTDTEGKPVLSRLGR